MSGNHKPKPSHKDQPDLYDAALMAAHIYNDQEVINALLKCRENINTRINSNGDTLLHIAVERNYPILVDFLLQAGAKPDKTTSIGYTPLMLAASDGHVESVVLLLNKGASLDLANSYGTTALMQAAADDHLDVVKLLVERGATLDKLCNFGDTALSRATMHGHVETAIYLIERGAGLLYKNSGNKTVLTWAMESSPEIFAFIMSRQRNILNALEPGKDKDQYRAIIDNESSFSP